MRVLIVRFSALGDITLSLPILQQLNEQYPNLELFYLSKPFAKSLVSSCDVKFVDIDLKSKHKGIFGLFKLSRKIKKEINPDLVIDLHQVLRSKILNFFFGLSAIKVFSINKGRAEKKALTRRGNKIRKTLKHSSLRYADVFQEAGYPINFKTETFQGLKLNSRSDLECGIKDDDINVGIAPMAQHKGKSWPLRSMKILIQKLIKDGRQVYLFGGTADFEALNRLSSISDQVVNLVGKGNLLEELNFMKKLHVFVAMDSSNMHMASMVNIPVVSIWGATHSDAGFGPLGENHELKVEIEPEQLECRPCSVFGNKECFRGDYACLEEISPNRVMEKINLALKKNSNDA